MKEWDGDVQPWSESYEIKPGGLFRCCLDTIRQVCTEETEPKDGQVIDCRHEDPGNGQILVKDKMFLWNKGHVLA